MKRRDFLAASAAATAGLALASLGCAHGAAGAHGPAGLLERRPPRIPRYRGANLTELTGGQRGRAFLESDFEWLREWGFDFARLPLSYWAWSTPGDWMRIDEAALAPIDQAVEWGRQHGIHINLCMHRIPGYCVNQRELEPHLLFDSSHVEMEQALVAATHHWAVFAERYRGIPSDRVSFDLFNEPPWMPDQGRYVEVARALVAAIRAKDPDRLIFADGADIGQTPVLGIADLGLVQSTRGYLPKMVSHYTATWVPANEFESLAPPTWPMTDARGVVWNRDKLRAELIDKWQPIVRLGIPIHVGEWGCFNRTPHDVALAWMRDLLSLWREAGWGWSIWNMRGSFGFVDSERADAKYEDFRGHKLDREMLELLRAH
jgi:endoglucanase